MSAAAILPLVQPLPPAFSAGEVMQLRLLLQQLQGVPDQGPTVAAVVDSYLVEARRELAPGTFAFRKHILLSLSAKLGGRRVRELVPHDLLAFLNGQKGWVADDTRRSAIHGIKRCFNWGKEMGLIDSNPFADFRAPGGHRRRPLSGAEFRQMLRHSPALFRRVLVFLWLTGCRPCELTALRWQDIHLSGEGGWIVLATHKTSKKTGKPRKIPLVPTVVKLLAWLRRQQELAAPTSVREWLVATLAQEGERPAKEMIARAIGRFRCSSRAVYKAKQDAGIFQVRKGGIAGAGKWWWQLPQGPGHPQEPAPPPGYVFLNHSSEPWCRLSMGNRLARLRRKADLPPDATLYGCRHAFGTNAILRGVDVLTLSKLMGHESIAMTSHYVHLAEHPEHLERAMRQAAGLEG